LAKRACFSRRLRASVMVSVIARNEGVVTPDDELPRAGSE
jgi:hypothetical protein